jgi:hypothetical protein
MRSAARLEFSRSQSGWRLPLRSLARSCSPGTKAKAKRTATVIPRTVGTRWRRSSGAARSVTSVAAAAPTQTCRVSVKTRPRTLRTPTAAAARRAATRVHTVWATAQATAQT